MFSTLQRPTLEELERRRAFRETMSKSPPVLRKGGSGLKRRESMLARGFNALFRKESFAVNNNNNIKSASNLNLNNRFDMHLNLRTATGPPGLPPDPPLGMKRHLSRAMSFKHPERISHIPPPEVTRLRLRSKSQHAIDPSAYDLELDLDSEDEPHEIIPRPMQQQQRPVVAPVPRQGYAVRRQQSFMPPRLNGPGGLGHFPQRPPIRRRQRQSLMPDLFYNIEDRWNDLSNEISQEDER